MKLFLVFLIIVQSISYCQGDFLVNFYNRDFNLTKPDIKSLFINDPGVRVSKDSANHFVLRGIKWRGIETNKVEMFFVEDTIANFIIEIKDTLNIHQTFNSILDEMIMQFGNYQITNKLNDNICFENRMWQKNWPQNPDFVLQLSIYKRYPDFLYISYMNIHRLNKSLETK